MFSIQPIFATTGSPSSKLNYGTTPGTGSITLSSSHPARASIGRLGPTLASSLTRGPAVHIPHLPSVHLDRLNNVVDHSLLLSVLFILST